jgi:hypothetical protein
MTYRIDRRNGCNMCYTHSGHPRDVRKMMCLGSPKSTENMLHMLHMLRSGVFVCFSGDLFVGNAGFKFSFFGFLNTMGTGFAALSSSLRIILDTRWSFMCHWATYFEYFLTCFFEVFQIGKGQNHE